MPSPFKNGEVYDLLFESLEFDLELYKSAAKLSTGPILDLACGTGRVAMRLLEMGAEVDGLDLYQPMLDHFHKKASARGFKPHLYTAEMKHFRLPRKYALIICAFNAFAHNLTQQDQVSSLRSVRDHLLPGGVFICHMSFPTVALWSGKDGVPELEAEVPHSGGGTIRIYDSRTKNPVEQTQHSVMEIQILDKNGKITERYPSETDVRWIYKPEFELLLKSAGFSKFEIKGGFNGEPMTKECDQMVVFAYR